MGHHVFTPSKYGDDEFHRVEEEEHRKKITALKTTISDVMVGDDDLPMAEAWSSKKHGQGSEETSKSKKTKLVHKVQENKVAPNKSFEEVVKDHDLDHLENKEVMIRVKGAQLVRVKVVGGGLQQLRVQELGGAVRRIPWSAMVGWAE